MRVRHFANTANNAYHNVLLLKQFEGIESELPIRMFGLEHAISAPAWETVEFDVPTAEWVAQPDWSDFPEAQDVNSRFTDLPTAPVGEHEGENNVSSSSWATALRRRLFGPLRTQPWAQPLIVVRDRQLLARRPAISEGDDAINLLYGSSSLFVAQPPASPKRTVCMEHGTLRWIADGRREEKAFREAYRHQVQEANHVWVTNLDPRTLEIAEDVIPGRWTAFPHPFALDPRVPFLESPGRRAALLAETRSEALVLLAASQNWAKDHDKGSIAALGAFVELRRSGRDVGLVAVEWGRQVNDAKEFLVREGVAGHVAWVPPMARLTLQRTMANVDLVWDQFGLEVFGALALRTLEQGTPLVSRGLAPEGNRFIGGAVPWSRASNVSEIVHETERVLDEVANRGRGVVISETRSRYRAWLTTHHSPALTASLQRDVYRGILDGSFRSGDLPVDAWARRIDLGAEGQ